MTFDETELDAEFDSGLTTLADYHEAFAQFHKTWQERPGFRYVTLKAIDVLLDDYLENFIPRMENA
jgi:hypothetical protein